MKFPNQVRLKRSMEKDINETSQKLNKLDELTPIKNHMEQIQKDLAGINNRIREVEEDVQDLG